MIQWIPYSFEAATHVEIQYQITEFLHGIVKNIMLSLRCLKHIRCLWYLSLFNSDSFV